MRHARGRLARRRERAGRAARPALRRRTSRASAAWKRARGRCALVVVGRHLGARGLEDARGSERSVADAAAVPRLDFELGGRSTAGRRRARRPRRGARRSAAARRAHPRRARRASRRRPPGRSSANASARAVASPIREAREAARARCRRRARRRRCRVDASLAQERVDVLEHASTRARRRSPSTSPSRTSALVATGRSPCRRRGSAPAKPFEERLVALDGESRGDRDRRAADARTPGPGPDRHPPPPATRRRRSRRRSTARGRPTRGSRRRVNR